MRLALVTLHGWMVMYVIFQYLCLGKIVKRKIKGRKNRELITPAYKPR